MILLRGAALRLDTHQQKVSQALALLPPVPVGATPGACRKCRDSCHRKRLIGGEKSTNALFPASLVRGKEERDSAEQLRLLFRSSWEQFCQAARFPSVSLVFVVFLSN